ncbi:PIN domain-containing protein [Stenomitos frigidus]|uniref:Nucleic-acid-binding protein, contains PIN domain protein n=1 Tax=Stenomitos frigidus ULC18 TaxID=2107698 RepID=A0A2T1DXE0_9CYAN|nr:PIN domain-containing protein [Stenomitos frigidus]PSB25176.1 nucleic-acid-binding protein, contains PIN domain protein [Stenomitos frigidus ULC18]
MKRVLFDSDVLLDVFLQRQPHFTASAIAIDTVGQGKIEGYVAGHAVTNLFYLLRRQLERDQSRDILATLLLKMHVAAVTDAVIREALASSFTDFEDAVAHAAAKSIGVEIIVTRNIKDFRSGTIPAVLPEVFLATL